MPTRAPCVASFAGRLATLRFSPVDGRRQRNALTAAEQAVMALRAGDAAQAERAAERAAELDQIGVFADLPAAVTHATGELDRGTLSDTDWERIAAALPPGPLRALAVEGFG